MTDTDCGLIFLRIDMSITKQNSTTDDETLNDGNLPSQTIKQRSSQIELVTRMYYPDTLYPDGYSFFADRTDQQNPLSRDKAPVHILTMDSPDQYPTSSTTDPMGPASHVSTISKQENDEIEIIDRPNKYPVSRPMIFISIKQKQKTGITQNRASSMFDLNLSTYGCNQKTNYVILPLVMKKKPDNNRVSRVFNHLERKSYRKLSSI